MKEGNRRKDDGPTLAGAAHQGGNTEQGSPNFRSPGHFGQALRTLDGERKAAAYLERLRGQQADPDELALIVAQLYGATLRGFCRIISKALGVSHG